MFVFLGFVVFLGAATAGLTVLAARRPDAIGGVAQRAARTLDQGVVRTRQAVSTLTVPDRGTTSYFAQDRTEATWLFGIGLVGVAVAMVLGATLIFG